MNNVSRARAMRRHPTESERALWYLVRDKRLGGFKFRRQHPMGDVIVDFACLRAGVIVEVDGPVHEESVQADRRKDEWLSQQGFSVLRFTDQDVLERSSDVAERILAACRGE
jgi:very-short-patch-repair endonuclease